MKRLSRTIARAQRTAPRQRSQQRLPVRAAAAHRASALLGKPAVAPPRAGITLLELLAVVVIVLTLTAVAIPVVTSALSGRRAREAARMVSVFISGAKTRAAQLNRPVGIVLERFPGQPEMSVTLSYAEIPPPYAGDTTDARVIVENGIIKRFEPDHGGWKQFIKPGEAIQFNYQGHAWRMFGQVDGNGFLKAANDGPPVQLNWTLVSSSAPYSSSLLNFPSPGVPFQIIRNPVPLSAGAIQLPDGIAIDLNGSGFDEANAENNPSQPQTRTWSFEPSMLSANEDSAPVAILFSPNGSLHSVYSWRDPSGGPPDFNNPASADEPVWAPIEPLSAVHLLIGRRAYIPSNLEFDAADDESVEFNWFDPTAMWVSIHNQTGLVTTTEVLPENKSLTSNYDKILASRQFAREAQAMGGR